MREALTYGSWLVYATKATHPDAVRIKDVIIFIKRDQIQAETRRPYVELVVERMASGLGPELVDDVVTSGTALMAGARRRREPRESEMPF